MMMAAVAVVVMVPVATISPAFWLEGCLHLHELRAQAFEHILDHMVGPNAKNLVSNFSRKMPISEMPSKSDKLTGVFVSDFDNQLDSGPNLQPPPVFQLQAISIGHGNRFRKVEKNVFPLIRSQENAAPMARIKIESKSACCFFLRPMPSRAMNGSSVHRHPQYRK
jgi:hypothetical protein